MFTGTPTVFAKLTLFRTNDPLGATGPVMTFENLCETYTVDAISELVAGRTGCPEE